MLNIVFVTLVLSVFIFAGKVHAIVLLPAIILIPIVKLVAIVMAGLSVPIASVGVFVAKATKNKQRTTKIILGILVLTLLITVIILRLQYPAHPWV